MSTTPIPELADGRSRTDAAARVAQLFERHGRMVYGICRSMLRDAHDAEDATQQAFLSAYRALLGSASVRDEGAWIATIARNECRARITAAMKTPLPVPEEDIAAIPDTNDEIERRLHSDALRDALAELPARQREAVVLRDLYGLRYGEVATALGLSRPATEALLFRARRAMRHRLRPAIATTLVVPIAVQEGLAQAIPGFATAGSGAAFAGMAGGGLLAKLTAGPVGVKVATAAVAVTTVGAVGTVDSERGGRDRAERSPVVAVAESEAAEINESSGRGRSGDDEGADDRSGSGRRGDDNAREGDDNSGPGSSADEKTAGDDDSSGPGSGSRDPSDDDSSGSGSGEPNDAVEGDSADTVDSSSGSGSPSSGSGSGDDSMSEGSSGSGSGSSGSGGGDSDD